MAKTLNPALLGSKTMYGAPVHPRGVVTPLSITGPVYTLSVTYAQAVVGTYMNVMHFVEMETPSGAIADVLDDLVKGFETQNLIKITGCMASDCTVVSMAARRLQGGSPTVTGYIGAPGTLTGTVDNTAIARNIDFIPGQAPWNYGHWYQAGCPDDQFSANQFHATYDAPCAALAESLISAFVGGNASVGHTWIPVIYERKTQLPREISNWQVDARPTVMGRRLRPWNG